MITWFQIFLTNIIDHMVSNIPTLYYRKHCFTHSDLILVVTWFNVTLIIIIIMLLHQHGYPRSFLATVLCRPLLPVGLQGFIPYRHRAAVCRFKLVVQNLFDHMKGSTGLHHLFSLARWESSSLPSGQSACQWPRRQGFNLRSSHTKDLKMVLDTSLLTTQDYKVRIKGKVEKSGGRSGALLYISL